MERNLVLGAHLPTGGSGVEIKLARVKRDRICGDGLAGDLLAAFGAVYDAVIGTARFVGSSYFVLYNCLAGGMDMRSLGGIVAALMIAYVHAVHKVIRVQADVLHILGPVIGAVGIIVVIAAGAVLGAIAAVAVVNIPVGAAGLLVGERVDGYLVGIYNIDTIFKIIVVGRAVGQGVIVALVRALDVGVDSLSRLIVDGLRGIGAAVNAVVKDCDSNVLGDVGIVDALGFILDFHAIADPLTVYVGVAAPPVHASVVLAVENIVLVVPCGSLITRVDHDLVVLFLDDLAGIGIELLRMMEIDILIRDRTGRAVRHLEVDALSICVCFVFFFPSLYAFGRGLNEGNALVVNVGNG